MTPPIEPQVDAEQYHASLRVADLSAAIEFYTTRLGFLHAFSWGEPPTMAGVNLGQTQVFLEAGLPTPPGCSLYFVGDNADELREFHRTNGVPIVQAPGDRPWELRDYTVRDLDGYALTFGHRIPPGAASRNRAASRSETSRCTSQGMTSIISNRSTRFGRVCPNERRAVRSTVGTRFAARDRAAGR